MMMPWPCVPVSVMPWRRPIVRPVVAVVAVSMAVATVPVTVATAVVYQRDWRRIIDHRAQRDDAGGRGCRDVREAAGCK
jgi:hypothetical protein